MNGFAVLLTIAAVGIDYGWQPGRDGQLEYIIQIQPNQLDSLRHGQDITSEISPEARGVRRFRIHVGTGPVPRISSNPARLDGTGNGPNTGIGAGYDRTMGGRTPRSVPDLSPTTGTLGATPPAANTTGGIPLLNLPPPPWTPDERNQLHSVLIRNSSPARSDTSSPPPGATYSGTNSNSGMAADSILPDMPPSSAASGSRVSGGNSAPPAGATAFPTYPGPVGTLTHRNGTGSTGHPMRRGDAPPAPHSGVLGPPAAAQPTPPTNDEILPRRPISAPGAGRYQTPIRDPSASTSAGAHHADRTRNPVRPGTTTPHRRAKLMDLVRRNTEPQAGRAVTTPIASLPTGLGEASSKPVIDSETADKLVDMQVPKPWMPLVLTSLGLFASLAANAYLAWIAIGVYRRYRQVVAQLHDATTAVI